jgi:mycothiol system anti-sigma-R factor
MNCQEAQKFIHAYLDGEFDQREWGAIAAHIEACEPCKRMARFEERFRQALKQSLPPARAPRSLRERLEQELEKADAAIEIQESWSQRWLWRLIPAAAAAALIVTVMISKSHELSPLSLVAEDSIEWHRRQLPMDVTASSAETVQRFFSDKVPFAVRPPTFASPKAKLVGARLSNLREHNAVYLTYDVGGKRVSVFIFDPSSFPVGGRATRVGRRDVYWEDVKGYKVAMYTSGGTGYAVASDMDSDRMVQLISHSE